MAIKSIRVKNFKSFKDVKVHLGDFNVLIGANASGKSNFIHIIEFLRDIRRHGLENAISLQGGPEYLTNLNIGSHAGVTVEVMSAGEPDENAPGIGTSRRRSEWLSLDGREICHSFSLRFARNPKDVEVVGECLSVKGEFIVSEPISGGRAILHRKGLGRIAIVREGNKPCMNVAPPDGVSLDDFNIEPWLARQDVSSSSLLLQGGKFRAGGAVEDSAIYDFDPKLPKKGTPITGKAELEEDASNLAIVLKRIVEDEPAKLNLTNLLQDLLPFVSGLDIERFADNSLLLSVKEKFAEGKLIPASFISDGTINVLALIVALYFEKKPIAVFEEPERNVHPHLISRIVTMMKEASRRKQVIVTTQNPEVVRNADVTDVLLVSRDKEGFSTISRPAERDDVRAFLQNEMGLEELFAQNLLHA